MRFFLGIGEHAWMQRLEVPVFISRRRLERVKNLRPASCDWALDSGGFTELSLHGRWTINAPTYARAVRRYADEIGRMQFAAPMDAMCESWVLEKSAAWLGGTVEAHQRWTVDNYCELRTLAADLPFIPVLQGATLSDYLRCAESYYRRGIDLHTLPLVGLGSVCRREATSEIQEIVTAIASHGIKLHGFGVKTSGLSKYGSQLASADSFAWSFGGRHIRPCPIKPSIGSCANCMHHALAWRDNVLQKAEQLSYKKQREHQ